MTAELGSLQPTVEERGATFGAKQRPGAEATIEFLDTLERFIQTMQVEAAGVSGLRGRR